MKLLKKLVAAVALLAVVGVLAIVALVFLIDPNKLKPVIVNEVMKKTGYHLVIEGDLTWSFYPTIGVKVKRISLRAPDEKETFADLHNVTIATQLTQLLQGKEKLQGKVHISDINLAKVRIQNARMNLHWQNNILTLDQISGSLYQGSFKGIVHAKELSATPNWDWDIKADGVQLKLLLEDMNGTNTKIKLSGIAKLNLQAETRGKNKEQLLHNLNGKSDFILKNGSISGMDLNYFIQTADALISQQPIAGENSNETRFESLTGSIDIRQGVAESNNLLLTSSSFITKGQGSFDIVNQMLDYKLFITPTNTAKLKWPLPVLVDGNLHDPSIRLDIMTLKTLISKDQIERVKDRVNAEIKQLPQKADEFLQKILGR